MDIYIAPLKFSNTSQLKDIRDFLLKKFLSHVHIINLDIEVDSAFLKGRGQYYSTQIISAAAELTKELQGKILLLTELDLCIPVLTFVFGEAQLNGKHSIVSVCRLHEEFYSEESNEKLLMERIKKEVLHELGHNFGLKHCTDWDCVMHSSPGIEEVDIKGGNFCKSCISK
ncbi:MAG TPA: archaemetzincin, partial [Ignavibacteriaceae bacterium]|nr:archaemetzincin [Ignavibacteriaceae bacterium]